MLTICALYTHIARVTQKKSKIPRKAGPTKHLSLSQDSLDKCGDLMKALHKPNLIELVETLILESHRENISDKRTFYFPENQ